MGVPNGHPFFGNQYTTGGYIPGSFTYIPEVVEKFADFSTKLVSENIGKGTAGKAINSVATL